MKTRWLGITSLFLAFGATWVGCGKPQTAFNSEAVVGASCAAATDQRDSFMAKVPGFPLQIAVDADFSSDEIAAIQQAVDRWNDLGNRMIGGAFFTMKKAAINPDLRAANPNDCTSPLGNPGTFSVLKEQSADRWKSLGFGDNIPGATLRCYSGQDVSKQVVLLYTKVINTAQFSTVVLHELGHSLGLDHSCATDKVGPKYLACAGLADSHPYHAAVMFPSLRLAVSGANTPEIKDTLRPNDLTRTQCMYGGQ